MPEAVDTRCGVVFCLLHLWLTVDVTQVINVHFTATPSFIFLEFLSLIGEAFSMIYMLVGVHNVYIDVMRE